MTRKYVTTRAVYEWRDGAYREVAREGYWYRGPWALAMDTQALSWAQNHWRWFNDDAATIAGCTAAANQDTAITPTLDTPYHLRVQKTNTGGAIANIGPKIQFRVDSGSWLNLTTTSTPVRFTAAGNASFPADRAAMPATASLTQVGSAGYDTSGNYWEAHTNFASEPDEISANSDLETQYCVRFLSAGLSGGEVIQFRLVDNVFGDDLPDVVGFGAPTANIASAAAVITAAQGSYALTGQATGLRAARRITAAQGSYALTGQATGLKRGFSLVAEQGSYALTGQEAGARATRAMLAEQGSYALTGQAAGLKRDFPLVAEQGSYALTGQAAGIAATRTLAADQGAYALNGQDAALLYSGAGEADKTITAEQGGYALTGQEAALRAARMLAAAQGSYALTGQDAALRAARALAAAQGSYALAGQDAALLYSGAGDKILTAEQGGYALTGQTANLRAARMLAAVQGSYSLSGQAVTLTYAPSVVADPVVPGGGRMLGPPKPWQGPLGRKDDEEVMTAVIKLFLEIRR